ncbi:MAG TPA: ClpX C4-type zinc finger protein [Acidimicrobiales bacterium]|jgi:hypothetical protein|nr:ClpX C4-type zinc finger protein [Acidimicrobiales bacterium]
MPNPAPFQSSCSFCGRGETQVGLVVRGGRGAICSSCLEAAYAVLEDEGEDSPPADGPAPIRGALAQVWVPDVETALPLYQRLAGSDDVRRLHSDDLDLARVGPFLLLTGSTEATAPYRDRVATLLVDDIDEARAALLDAGASLVEGPGDSLAGTHMIARHPDGAVFEYLEESS